MEYRGIGEPRYRRSACTINQLLKNLCSGTQCEGFQFLLILDLCGLSIHTVVVFGLGKKLLFKSILGHCAPEEFPTVSSNQISVRQ